jgi:hypothetical protein
MAIPSSLKMVLDKKTYCVFGVEGFPVHPF